MATQASPIGQDCLNITSSGIELERIKIDFVSRGVAVFVGGQLTMRDCTLCGKAVGITVSNNIGAGGFAGPSLRAIQVSVGEG